MIFVLAGSAQAQSGGVLVEEFGLTTRELVQKIEKAEALIAECMRAQGFEYVAVDAETVRRGMQADKMLPGLDESEFIAKYGFGIATLYTGKPPQLATGYSPAKMGLGRRNVYNRVLFGENTDVTFMIGLEQENFSRTGGCTRAAVEQAFDDEQLKATYYNPMDALVAKDPRMRAALREYTARMRDAGFDADNPDTLESEIRDRLYAITGGATVPIEGLSPEQLDALEKLQNYERRLAVTNLMVEIEVIEPVEMRVERELFARRIE
jgi:hypothetical protein